MFNGSFTYSIIHLRSTKMVFLVPLSGINSNCYSAISSLNLFLVRQIMIDRKIFTQSVTAVFFGNGMNIDFRKSSYIISCVNPLDLILISLPPPAYYFFKFCLS